ncbi:MAG: hypothetical protein ACLPWG_10280 [Steroidobacteraceae bacterium]
MPRIPPSLRARAVLASALGLVVLAGCGQSANTPAPVPAAPPPIAAKPDVIVTLDGARHDCLVALYSEPQGNIISCDDVAAFVRDELRVPSGAIYDVRTAPNIDEAQRTKVEASLKGAGYRYIKGPLPP